MVSGCDRVGRTVAPTPADPGSNPAIGNFHGSFVYKNNCLGKTKIKIQRLRIAIFYVRSLWQGYL